MEFLWKGRQVKLQGGLRIIKEFSSNGNAREEHGTDQAYLIVSSHNSTQLYSLKLEGPDWEQPTDPRKAELMSLLKSYGDVFETPKELPPPRSMDHGITLKEGSNPVNLKAYRYGALQKTVIEELVQEMLDLGVIRQSQSEFASPVVLVKKKDNSWRFCVDYRKLNSLTVRNQFPIPIVEELIDELYGACYFSKLDLRSGDHQIHMKESDICKTAFSTHEGLYEFTVMPFGLSNAPATFQHLMNSVFKAYLRKFLLVFFDQIVVYSSSWEDHRRHLQVVLDVLRTQSLFAKFSKCRFASQQVDYLGHVISGEGVKVDPQKVVDMVDWPTPSNLQELRGFLGLTGYYRSYLLEWPFEIKKFKF